MRFDAGGERKVLMQTDQILYLHPHLIPIRAPIVDVDGHTLPDVVLEVDYSTDVRVRKLPLYEAWGFPEVWVDVPDERSPSRPKSPPFDSHDPRPRHRPLPDRADQPRSPGLDGRADPPCAQ